VRIDEILESRITAIDLKRLRSARHSYIGELLSSLGLIIKFYTFLDITAFPPRGALSSDSMIS